ncbi:MAG: glycosyltransferase [Melioribacteraceae bacterium]|nr:glycosyltransferase [Melioribacteraceae bacterium]
MVVIHWSINEEAPFNFNLPPEVTFYPKPSLSKENLLSIVAKSNPAVIISSGWIDKDYLAVCKQFRKTVPIILGMDNVWKGGARQIIGLIIGRLLLKRYFEYIWIPGEPQISYARKLGFSEEKMLLGNYSADFNYFNSLYKDNYDNKKRKFPHIFLFVGRYIEAKGIRFLVDTFSELKHESKDWELWCVGTGELKDQFYDTDKIKHLGFIQPQDLNKVIENSGVFVLPSEYDPWGVVVHEFATAGFPLLLSTNVGAGTLFVEEGENGFVFPNKNKTKLIELFRLVMDKSDDQLFKMSIHSNNIASAITPEKWTNTLLTILARNKN